MATANEHEEQAASNEEFYREIGGSDAQRPDWAITVLFYTAVQEVEALIARKKWTVTTKTGAVVRPTNHQQREKAMKQHCPGLVAEFSALQDWSEGARYQCQSFTAANVKLAEATLRSLQSKIRDLG